MVTIEAFILSADFVRLAEQAREAEIAGVDAIQVDVMDGRFVSDITFGPGVVRALRPLIGVPLDVHLMIVEPEKHGRLCRSWGKPPDRAPGNLSTPPPCVADYP